MSDYQAQLELRIARLEKTLEALAAREHVAFVSPWSGLAGGVVYVDNSGTGALTTEAAFIYDDVNNELVYGRGRLTEQATPSAPPNPFAILFANSVGTLSGIDDAGVVRQMVRYATATFVPTLSGSGTAGTFTYDATNTVATYWRIENTVFIEGRIRLTAIAVAPTGNLRIGNLPFTSATVGHGVPGSGTLPVWRGITYTAGMSELGIQILSGVAVAEIIESGSGIASANVQGGALALIAGVANFVFECTYQAVP